MSEIEDAKWVAITGDDDWIIPPTETTDDPQPGDLQINYSSTGIITITEVPEPE